MYCTKCGREMSDDDVYCPNCGSSVHGYNTPKKDSTMFTVIKVFMIISCVVYGFALFPLLWMVPMTQYYIKTKNEGKNVSMTFKILTLIFVNVIPGILMIIDES